MGKTVFLNKSYEMRLMKYWERRTAPLRWAVMSLYVENLSDKAKSQAERNMPLAKAMAVNGMTARIMEPIWEKRRTREILKNNNEKVEGRTIEKDTKLYRGSFYLVQLFQGPYDEMGLTNVAVNCHYCQRPAWLGELCRRCNLDRMKISRYTSPICSC